MLFGTIVCGTHTEEVRDESCIDKRIGDDDGEEELK